MSNHKPLPRGVDSLLRETLTANLLRYAAGKIEWCPTCVFSLDWQHTVVFAGITLCDDCFCKFATAVDMPANAKRERFQRDDCDCARNIHVDDNSAVTYGAIVLTED